MHRLRLPTTALGLLAIALCAGCSPAERHFGSGADGQGGGAGGPGSGPGAGGQGDTCAGPEDCPAPENTSPACDAGVCGFTCDPGFLDCDAAAPGCETSARDPAHCGACGNRCATACVVEGDSAFCNDPVELSAGFAHTCALRRDGSVWCWGRNLFGEAGKPGGDEIIAVPARVELPGKAAHIAAGGGFVSSGGDPPAHSCAVMEDTTVTCWGSGERGQLGDGLLLPAGAPKQVTSLVNVGQLSLGGAHACAVKKGDELYCWGSDEDGQIGDGAATAQTVYPTPILIQSDLRQVAAGQDHTCAIKASDGSVLCWGRNSDAQLGIGSQDSVSSPVAILEPLVAAGVDEVTAGDRHTCLRKGAEVYCFGSDYNGAVGVSYFSPVPDPTLVAVPAAVHIDVGRERSGAVSGDARRLLMWGVPVLGDGSEMLSPQPVAVALDGVAQLAVGYEHTCALRTTGEVFCWGANTHGQLGVGLEINFHLSPTAVPFPP